MAATTYSVAKGDTLYGISRKFGISVDELKALNGLSSNNLNVGQVLQVSKTVAASPPPVQSARPQTGTATYTVVAGDTLYGISRKTGTSVDDLRSLNGLTTNNLNIGQVLTIRGQASGTSTPTPTPTPPPPVVTPPPPVYTGSNYLTARQQFRATVQQEAGFRRYFLTVPLPYGGQVVANMRDNLTYSAHMVYPNGVSYAGQSHIGLDLNTVESVGLTPAQASALQYVSTHEGSFDAINSYDKAIFSYGFIQFAGAAAVGASLNRVLASMEANAPGAFQNIFRSVGIDTEGFGGSAIVSVLDDNGYKKYGDDAWMYIQQNIPLYGAFIQAGFEPSLVREQLRMANELYVQPALNYHLNLNVGGINISVPRVSDILTSEAAMTIIIALAINQGSGGMSRLVADALSRVATQRQLNTLYALQQVNEREVFETLVAGTTDPRIRDRTTGILNSGLSFA